MSPSPVSSGPGRHLVVYFLDHLGHCKYMYRIDPKFSDRQVWANSDPDQGLHCLPFNLHYLDTSHYGKSTLFNFRMITVIFSGVRNFRIFTKFMDVLEELSPLFFFEDQTKTHFNSYLHSTLSTGWLGLDWTDSLTQ